MAPVIDARGVTHEYPDGARALADVDLTVGAGERVAVLGANGSGKSTLQLVLGGLLAPTAGTVRYFGETTDAEAVRDRLGVLLQNPEDYLFNTTVREDIEYGPAQLGHDRETARRRVADLAADLGLTDLLDRAPFRLSGGEKQRAAVASVLAFDPDVLLLDEPLGALDPMIRSDLQDDLRDIFQHLDKTVVFVTHDLSEAAFIGDRIVLLRGGEIIQTGSMRDLLDEPENEFVEAFVQAQRSAVT